jgi:hypothetical protein
MRGAGAPAPILSSCPELAEGEGSPSGILANKALSSYLEIPSLTPSHTASLRMTAAQAHPIPSLRMTWLPPGASYSVCSQSRNACRAGRFWRRGRERIAPRRSATPQALKLQADTIRKSAVDDNGSSTRSVAGTSSPVTTRPTIRRAPVTPLFDHNPPYWLSAREATCAPRSC